MTTEQTEMEREAVPIPDRCYRGCGTRAVIVEDGSAFCAKCFVARVEAGLIRLPRLAA
jgi:hypothetical protein